MEKHLDHPAECGFNQQTLPAAEDGHRPLALAEFSSGIGGAAVALAPAFRSMFSNDINLEKAACQRLNLGHEVDTRSIEEVRAADLPLVVDLAWNSFPCPDHSSLGKRRGFRKGKRGRLVFEFIRILRERRRAGLAMPALCLENVQGFVSHGRSRDFVRLVSAIVGLGYRVSAVIMEGADFACALRKRLFVVAWPARVRLPDGVLRDEADLRWTTPKLREAVGRLPKHARDAWRWLSMPEPPPRATRLEDLLEHLDGDGEDYPEERVRRWLSICHERHVVALRERAGRGTAVGVVDSQRSVCPVDGVRRHKFHDGGTIHCLTGGNARQRLLICEDGAFRMRDFTERELMRLSGLPDWYVLQGSKKFLWTAVGEGLSIPCVAWLGQHVLAPVAGAVRAHREAAEERARKAAEPPAPPSRQQRTVQPDEHGVKWTAARQDLHLAHADNERLSRLALEWKVPKQAVLRELIDGGLEGRGMPLLTGLPGGRRDRQPTARKALPPRLVPEAVIALARELAVEMVRGGVAVNGDAPKTGKRRYYGGGAAHSSAHGEWWTPRWLLKALMKAFKLKQFDIDLFSPGARRSHVRAEVHFTKEDDAFKQRLYGTVFANPPYARKVTEAAVELCRRAYENGEVDRVVAVLPARPTTIWWSANVTGRADVIFPKGRIAFKDGMGGKGESPGHETAIVLWGATPEEVARVRAAFKGSGYMPKGQVMPGDVPLARKPELRLKAVREAEKQRPAHRAREAEAGDGAGEGDIPMLRALTSRIPRRAQRSRPGMPVLVQVPGRLRSRGVRPRCPECYPRSATSAARAGSPPTWRDGPREADSWSSRSPAGLPSRSDAFSPVPSSGPCWSSASGA